MTALLPVDATSMHPAPPSWHSKLSLEYVLTDQKTILAKRQHQGPLVVQKPFYPEGPGVCHTLPLFPPGGLAAGDHLHLDLELARGSQVVMTTPAAGKFYKSLGAMASQTVTAKLAEDSFLEWLPQETIIFDGANAELAMTLEMQAGAGFMGWEITCLGRTAAQEKFSYGRLRQLTRILIDRKLVWNEQAVLHGGDAILNSIAGLVGRPVTATFIAAGKNIDTVLIAACREITVHETRGDRCGITALPNIMIARYLGYSTERARHYFQTLWTLLRPCYAGRPACPPRIWKT